jgi:hypothetical protein
VKYEGSNLNAMIVTLKTIIAEVETFEVWRNISR